MLKSSLAISFLFVFNFIYSQQSYQYYDQSSYNTYDVVPSYTEEDVETRLRNMNLCIPPKYSSIVKSYVKTYMVTDRTKARAIIGRTVLFFPIMEKYIEERGLPKDLKFVSVLESALRPNAVSRSKAVGLWQFMEATAKGYDLKINSTVDERKDPHRSTQAALTYLEKLYNRYGDWALALAAYNGGPGRVNRAIKRGRSKNFWRISKYLPRETRNYVPAFFAAAYLINYYHAHNIEGDYPDLDLQITDVVKVYQTISFKDIAAITNIPSSTIEVLNPSYKKGIIPASPRGNYVILPQRVMGSFMQYLKYPDMHQSIVSSSERIQVNRHPNDHFFKTKYTVKDQDNIHSLAHVFKCSTYSIRAWNNMTSNYIHPGQELTIYQPFVSSDYQSEFLTASTQPMIPIARPPKVVQLKKYNTTSIASIPIEEIKEQELKVKQRSLLSLIQEEYLYYQIRRGESLSEIASKFPEVTLEDILDLNGIKESKNKLKPGSRIKIAKR